ncbi:hypothetical protein FHY64_16895 [Pelagovum pacificum]|uniref:Uncharacterized protein n=1 Tax=Pelagovum pacificum TaxID=2588711 RepID=A0A5C5G9U9_9RHOB|nr:hypothetical protein FHY64_16895 [Pelagovum pacificum]
MTCNWRTGEVAGNRDPAVGRNPLPACAMRPPERRAELCRLLALGLVRLHARNRQLSASDGESPLHSPPDQSGDATPTNRRDA